MIRGLVPATLAALLVASASARAQDGYTGVANARYVPVEQPGYVKLDAPLNPVPLPNIPYQVGGTLITNEAFYAHEMLYPHCYRALYAPYYYRVRGGWQWTSRGPVRRESWELMGTEVEVKYHSAVTPFALFIPPATQR